MAQPSKDVLQRLAALYPTRAQPSTFDVKVVPFHTLDDAALCYVTPGADHVLGLAGVFKPQRKLTALVVASPTSALVITGLTKNRPEQTRLLEERLCGNDSLRLLAVRADALAYGLYTDGGAHTTNVFNLHLTIPGGRAGMDEKVGRAVFGDPFAAGAGAMRDAVVRARECAVMRQSGTFLQQALIVSTKAVVPWVLDVAASLHRVSSLVDAQKPVIQNHDVEDVDVRKGKFAMTCRRYKTRVRIRGPKTIELTDAHGNMVIGTVKNIDGRIVMVSVNDSLPLRLKSVTSRGKECTVAEVQKEDLLLKLLQGQKSKLSRNPAFCAIWGHDTNDLPGAGPPDYASESTFPGSPMEFSNFVPTVISGAAARLAGIPLNHSQHLAVRTILRAVSPGKVDVDTIIGPPGTGKTMVIAASVVGLRSMERPVWLVAHSNVAVKNVAQKLADIGFWDFKLVVSEEFHYGWHEHLYTLIERNVILTSRLQRKRKKPPPIEALLGGSQVILCTLGTLTGSASQLSRCVPVETLIVDEASQTELGEYLVPMDMYGKMLQKIVFVGDDKQLAPYGQEQIGNVMRSIFEMPKHRARAVMLDTSYRLPRPICEFISRRVYDGKLRSTHDLSSRDSCKFVDVFNGVETQMGRSWQNAQEAAAAISLARLLWVTGKDFRIITPYDAQRVLIEESLKASGTPWHDRVFCVDSFQGNEAPYIILSTVRTNRPGFLTNVRRTNVMLTRCARGMYICTSKAFVYSAHGRKTLLGELAAEWRGERWITLPEIGRSIISCQGAQRSTADCQYILVRNNIIICRGGRNTCRKPAPGGQRY